MKLPAVCVALGLAGLFAPGLAGQMIKPGTPEWRAAFDPPCEKPPEVPMGTPLRRPGVERMAKRPVRFEGSLRAFRNWAIFLGGTVDKDGRAVKLPPMDNSDTVALWLRTKDGWRLVDWSAGHSDAFHIIWTEVYGAPKALVTGQEEAE